MLRACALVIRRSLPQQPVSRCTFNLRPNSFSSSSSSSSRFSHFRQQQQRLFFSKFFNKKPTTEQEQQQQEQEQEQEQEEKVQRRDQEGEGEGTKPQPVSNDEVDTFDHTKVDLTKKIVFPITERRQSDMKHVPLHTPYFTIETHAHTHNTKTPSDAFEPTISVTSNGIRVVSSSASLASPIFGIGVFINSGARDEQHQEQRFLTPNDKQTTTVSTSGISHFLELMAFKSTLTKHSEEFTLELLSKGANIACSASREHTIYTGDSLVEHAPLVISTLADMILSPAFHEEEVKAVIEAHEVESQFRNSNSDAKLIEAIHNAAYSGVTLGMPQFGSSSSVSSFTPALLRSWMETAVVSEQIVIATIGLDHTEATQLVEKAFYKCKSRAKNSTQIIKRVPAVYTGGEVRLHDEESKQTNIAIAFETASWHETDLVPMCVLQAMMGGGSSFSAGGPGKGMYTRLYTNVLNRFGWIDSASCFNSIFTDSSLLGFYFSSGSARGSSLSSELIKELLRLRGPIQGQELRRAKNQLKSNVLMHLESRQMKLEDIGKQLLTYERIIPPAEIQDMIEKVNADDIARVVDKALRTKPSVAIVGDASKVPSYEELENAIKRGL